MSVSISVFYTELPLRPDRIRPDIFFNRFAASFYPLSSPLPFTNLDRMNLPRIVR